MHDVTGVSLCTIIFIYRLWQRFILSVGFIPPIHSIEDSTAGVHGN